MLGRRFISHLIPLCERCGQKIHSDPYLYFEEVIDEDDGFGNKCEHVFIKIICGECRERDNDISRMDELDTALQNIKEKYKAEADKAYNDFIAVHKKIHEENMKMYNEHGIKDEGFSVTDVPF